MMELIEQLLARIVVLERWRETLVLPEIAAGNVGDLQVITAGGMAALGYNPITKERGFLVRIANGTGSASVKGSLVSASTAANDRFILQANEFDTIGVVAESGIANAALTWIWVTGSVCQVLYKNGSAATRGNILLAADTDGRAIDITNPGSGLPGTDTHFKECGHVLESKSAGTNVLALAMLHFN